MCSTRSRLRLLMCTFSCLSFSLCTTHITVLAMRCIIPHNSPYICAELPSNLLLRKIGPNILMPTVLTLWGLVVTLQGEPFLPHLKTSLISNSRKFLFSACRKCNNLLRINRDQVLPRSLRRPNVPRDRIVPLGILHAERAGYAVRFLQFIIVFPYFHSVVI